MTATEEYQGAQVHLYERALTNGDPIEPPHWDPHTSAAVIAAYRRKPICADGYVVILSKDRSFARLIPALCKSWDCPHCAPIRRKRLARQIRSGLPNLHIVLTTPPIIDETPVETCSRLKASFVKFVARIRRQLLKHPATRWGEKPIKTPALLRSIDAWDPDKNPALSEFEYALVWEVQRNGSPHAHILARSPTIPQEWISRTWEELGGGPIVWIEDVRGETVQAEHSAKAIPATHVKFTSDKASYAAKSLRATAVALPSLRIVQFSNMFRPPLPDKTDDQKTNGPYIAVRHGSMWECLADWLAYDVVTSYRLDPLGQLHVDKHEAITDLPLMIKQSTLREEGLAW